jgi:CheY-like chemotaxis protein
MNRGEHLRGAPLSTRAVRVVAVSEPNEPSHEKGRPDEAADQAPRNMLAVPRGSETVLLAEDEPTVRQLAARILRRQGYTVIEAADGAEALALVERSQDLQIDLLLTDIVMPRMGGYALMERLRQIRPTIKVLLTSGYTDSTTIIVNRLDYGVEFLGKPFTPTALARKVREVLDTQP